MTRASAGPHLTLVAAVARNRVIGAAGGLPWRESEDLRLFKRVTMGHAVIMGRKTWDSLGRPLPGRRNLVVSRQAGLAAPGAEVFASLDAAIAAARAGDAEPMVIGGAELYALALPMATRLVLTEIPLEPEGDARFPEIDPAQWRETARSTSTDARLVFRTLDRV